MTTTELWTPREVAEYLRVSVDTVHRYAQTGRLPTKLKVGPQRRFDPEVVKTVFAPEEPRDA